jgi:hypothetical protein
MYYNATDNEIMVCSVDINNTYSWEVAAGLWTRQGNNVYLRNKNWRAGIGTDKLAGILTLYEPQTQGAIHLAGKGDVGTYSALYLDDDDEDFTNRNTWVVSHKEDAGGVSENDFHITRWTNTTTSRLDLAIDSASGNVGLGTGNPQAKLDVKGGLVHAKLDCRVVQADFSSKCYAGSIVPCAFCDSDEWVMSGGASCGAGGTGPGRLTYNVPGMADPPRWGALCVDDSGAATDTIVRAVCCKK